MPTELRNIDNIYRFSTNTLLYAENARLKLVTFIIIMPAVSKIIKFLKKN